MPTLFLHIGMPKTGTTYLQKTLSENASILKKHGYNYPLFDLDFENASKRRNAHFLVPPNSDIKTEKWNSVYNSAVSNLKEIAKTGENLILSDEMIWVQGGKYLKLFKKDMNDMGYTVKIIVYLRRQDNFIQSYWGQLVKIAETKKAFSTFITDKKVNYYRLNYQKGTKFFADIFGDENMIVRVYENSQYGGRYNTLLSDFLEAVGLGEIDEKDEFVIQDSKTNAAIINPSLNGLYLHTKKLLNRNSYFSGKSNFSIYRLYEISKEDNNPKNTSTENLMTYEDRLNFLNKFEKSNLAVADKYLGGNGGALFKSKVKNNDDVFAKYSGTDVIDVCSEFIKREHIDFLAKKEEINSLKKEIKNCKKEKALLSKERVTLNHTISKQKEALDRLSVSFPTKVSYKLSRIFKSNKGSKKL